MQCYSKKSLVPSIFFCSCDIVSDGICINFYPLQELQLNILQQTHLMQAGERVKSSLILQQLQTKQQQLTAQLQLAQHALTLNMLIQTNGSKETVKGAQERDRHRSETQYSSDGSTKENQNNNNSSPLLHPGKINGNR